MDQMRVCSDSPYWNVTVSSSPTDMSGVPSEVENTNEKLVDYTMEEEEERERKKLLQTNRRITRNQWPQEQKHPRLKTKDQDFILSVCINPQIAMDGNDLFIVDGEECSKLTINNRCRRACAHVYSELLLACVFSC